MLRSQRRTFTNETETKRRRGKRMKETRKIERQNQRFDPPILRAIWLRRENILKTEVGPNVNQKRA